MDDSSTPYPKFDAPPNSSICGKRTHEHSQLSHPAPLDACARTICLIAARQSASVGTTMKRPNDYNRPATNRPATNDQRL